MTSLNMGLLRGRIGIQTDGQDNLVFGLKRGTAADPVVLTAPANSDKKLYALNAIQHLSLPDAEEVDAYAFYHSQLVTIDAPNVKKIGSNAFSANTLVSVNMPKLEEVVATDGNTASGGFANALFTSVSFPELKNVAQSMFSSCAQLESVNVPNVTSVGQNGFYNCTALKTLTLPKVTTLGARALYNCSALTDLYLPNTAGVVTLESTMTSQFPLHGTTCIVHVPASLLSQYQSAAGWSTISSRIVGDL